MDPSVFAGQLTGQAPVILVYVVSIIFCLVFITKYPWPAILALLALGLGFLVLVGYALIYAYLLHQREQQGWDGASLAQALQTVGIAANCLRALTLALLVAAVFVRRGRPIPAND